MRSWLAGAVIFGLAGAAGAADPPCRSVEVSFRPVGELQIAVWIEDRDGHYVDTAYVSRLTGTLGLANRPGLPRFKSDFRFPYGRRDMVLPVWAHKRDKHYGLVVMGGRPGNSTGACQASGVNGAECDDTTIGYHFEVSSPEAFFCSPRGGVTQKVGGVDTITCASGFYGCKGAYAAPPAFSLYPPRADLTSFVSEHDGLDARGFAQTNDLTAISGATPPAGRVIDPAIRWRPPADGPYVMKVEVSLEGDFNDFHRHPSVDDKNQELNGYGKGFLGQPSVVYAVPFTVGDSLDVELTHEYQGYGDWDGQAGTLHPPDTTLTTQDGSGAGRLMTTSDEAGVYRVLVRALPSCTGGEFGCTKPLSPVGLKLNAASSGIEAIFSSQVGGTLATRFDVRYRPADAITEESFQTAIPSSSSPPPPGVPGSEVSTTITGLRPETTYYVAVRSVAMCGTASSLATAQVTTGAANFVVLSGCFIATAAYGTEMARELGPLRRLRDQVLLKSPLGRLAVAAYYAFSPPLAHALAGDELLRAGARRLVAPVVRALRAHAF